MAAANKPAKIRRPFHVATGCSGADRADGGRSALPGRSPISRGRWNVNAKRCEILQDCVFIVISVRGSGRMPCGVRLTTQIRSGEQLPFTKASFSTPLAFLFHLSPLYFFFQLQSSVIHGVCCRVPLRTSKRRRLSRIITASATGRECDLATLKNQQRAQACLFLVCTESSDRIL